jgi:hypothetical protein
VLHAIIDLHIKSDDRVSLPPATLDHIGQFVECISIILLVLYADMMHIRTLHKTYVFVESQQAGGMIKRFFHNEGNSLLKDCQTELQQTMDVFKV